MNIYTLTDYFHGQSKCANRGYLRGIPHSPPRTLMFKHIAGLSPFFRQISAFTVNDKSSIYTKVGHGDPHSSVLGPIHPIYFSSW